jgi:hypothetical protein
MAQAPAGIAADDTPAPARQDGHVHESRFLEARRAGKR